jgi:aminomuconate-semialdehyde/2-hydroxymuconate-6-semialdehyde dehydrogenase
VQAAQALRLGDPKDPATEFGPLASLEHYTKVRSYVETIEAEGGKMRTGGLGDGWFVKPTIVVDAPLTARQWCEEIFGPVVVVQPFDAEADAIAVANDSPYGLNAMVFTENLSRATGSPPR